MFEYPHGTFRRHDVHIYQVAWGSVGFLDFSIILSAILANRNSKYTGPQLTCHAIYLILFVA